MKKVGRISPTDLISHQSRLDHFSESGITVTDLNHTIKALTIGPTIANWSGERPAPLSVV